MKIHFLIITSIFIFVSHLPTFGQTEHLLLKKADQSYSKQEYNKAEENYRRALENKPNETTKYNLGNSIMEQNRPKEAISYYEEAAKKNTKDLSAKAWYNLGKGGF